MPYVAEADVTLPRTIAVGQAPDGSEYQETESVTYGKGQVIDDDQVTSDVRRRVDDGDDHLSSLVRHVSDSEAKKIRDEQAGRTARVPEHEAEAEVFHQNGDDVLTRKEVVDLNQYGDPPVVEEETPDLSEGREAEGEEGDIRVHEVDDRRRGDAPAPEGREAASERGSSKEATRDELQERAAELDIEGRSSMNKKELSAAVAEAESQRASGSQGS